MSCLSTKVHNTASYLEMMQGNGFRSQCFWEVRYLCWITFASNADAVYSRFLKEKDNTDVRGEVSLCILHERDVIIEERGCEIQSRGAHIYHVVKKLWLQHIKTHKCFQKYDVYSQDKQYGLNVRSNASLHLEAWWRLSFQLFIPSD